MDRIRQHIVCDDCGADFDIRFDEEENEPAYCPFCGADLFWNEDDEEEDEVDDIYNGWTDPDDDEYE
jgi:hypothetical protein